MHGQQFIAAVSVEFVHAKELPYIIAAIAVSTDDKGLVNWTRYQIQFRKWVSDGRPPEDIEDMSRLVWTRAIKWLIADNNFDLS